MGFAHAKWLPLLLKSPKPSVNICLWHAIGIRLPQTISNKSLCQRKGQLPLKELMRRRSWQSIGRIGEVTIPAVATLWSGTHSPKMADERAGNKSWKEIKRISTNHERWRVGIFDALCPIKGWMVTIYMYKVIVFEYFFTFECPDKIFNLQRNLRPENILDCRSLTNRQI